MGELAVGFACGCVAGDVVRHQKDKATRNLLGETAAPDTALLWILAAVWGKLERAEHEAGAGYFIGLVACIGSDGGGRGHQHLGAGEFGSELERRGDVERWPRIGSQG